MPKIAALVPMRHHSQRVPGKNYRELAGKPLFHHIIETLQSVPEIDVIVVDTDPQPIKEQRLMLKRSSINNLAKKIAKDFNPEKIILFGSFAHGKPTEDSDVDMLVIMPFEGRSPKMATKIWMKTRPAFPLDLMVRRPEDIQERLEMGDFFIREIIEKGKVLYETTYA